MKPNVGSVALDIRPKIVTGCSNNKYVDLKKKTIQDYKLSNQKTIQIIHVSWTSSLSFHGLPSV